MARKELVNLIFHNALNAFAARIYFYTGINICRPHQIYVVITNRCDAKCVMCPCWKMKPGIEMDRERWFSILKEIKEFSKSCHVNFSGGEPLLRNDFLDILEFCADNNILCGFTTNARHIDKELAGKLMRMGLFNINISLDSNISSVHDRIRGVPGLFNKVINALDYLRAARKECRSSTRLIIKPTVMKDNFREMADLVKMAKDLSLDGVNFQPLFRWTEDYEAVKIDALDEFSKVIDDVISLKRKGYPVLNAVSNLEAMKIYYGYTEPALRAGNCEVGLNNFCIKPNGDVYLCYDYDSIGNLGRMSVTEVWHSPKAVAQRVRFKTCRRLCLATCQTKRSLFEKIDLFRDVILR